MTDYEDVVEAFVDGEPVAPDDLKRALAVAQGRDHLIDVLALRGLLGGLQMPSPSAVPVAEPARRLGIIRVAAIAAMALGLSAGSFLLGRRSGPIDVVEAPTESVVIDAPISAPAPTQVIRLQNGVDWKERTGGF
jgi:hypothetical protein